MMLWKIKQWSKWLYEWYYYIFLDYPRDALRYVRRWLSWRWIVIQSRNWEDFTVSFTPWMDFKPNTAIEISSDVDYFQTMAIFQVKEDEYIGKISNSRRTYKRLLSRFAVW
jgi:hypothetical protein